VGSRRKGIPATQYDSALTFLAARWFALARAFMSLADICHVGVPLRLKDSARIGLPVSS
jgi:hypothetical protein